MALAVGVASGIAVVALTAVVSRWNAADTNSSGSGVVATPVDGDTRAELEGIESRARSEPAMATVTPRVDSERPALPADVPCVSGTVSYRMDTEHSGPFVRPALGARVDFERGDRSFQSALTIDGHYSVADLAPGRWTVTARRHGFVAERREIVLASNERGRTLDFELVEASPIEVRVLVTNCASFVIPGIPRENLLGLVADRLASATTFVLRRQGSASSDLEENDVLDARGGVATLRPDGDVELTCTMRADPTQLPAELEFRLGHDVLASRPVDSSGAEVRSTLQRCLAGCGAVVLRVGGESGSILSTLVTERLSESGSVLGGTIVYPLVPAGPCSVRVSTSSDACAVVATRVHPGELIDLGEILLTKPGAIRGRWTGNARVEGVVTIDLELVVPTDGERARFEHVTQTAVEPPGDRFDFPQVPPGRYVVHAQDELCGARSNDVVVDVVPGALLEQDLELFTTTFLEIDDPSDSDTMLDVIAPNGRIVDHRFLVRVRPGLYTVRYSREGDGPREFEVDVGAEATRCMLLWGR